MKAYLRWSLGQLYLLAFWRTQFQREVEALPDGQSRLQLVERFGYLLKMLPWVVVLVALGNLGAGYACRAFGIPFGWGDSWGGVVFGVVFGVEVGVTIGIAEGVVLGVVFGGVGGMVGGMAGGMVKGVAGGVAEGIAGYVAAFSLVFWVLYFRILTYLWDTILTAWLILSVRLGLQTARSAWHWCAVTYDEETLLPLPFVGKLLTLLVQCDRAEGFRQIAFIAAERRRQRYAAVAAVVEVAVSDLRVRSVSELADVMEKLRWTTSAPAELPTELEAALPRFDRIAQYVGQYFALHSAYRKGDALSHAVEELEALQRSLIAMPAKAASRLLQAANAWRRLLEAEQATLWEQAAARQEIPNPFFFGKPVAETEHNVFTGRQDIAQQVEASILGAVQAPTLLLHGSRRMGKTSILNQLPRLLGPDFAPAVVDCQNPAVRGSAATLLRYLSRAVSDGLRRRRLTVVPLATAALEREPFAVFDGWLEKVERSIPQTMRVFLCLDEYERLQSTLDAGWGAAFLDTLRHTLQHRPRVALMFTGVHTFAELGPAWTDRFISARRVRVSFLTRDEILPLLTQPIPIFDMTYAPGALEAIYAATNGQPFLTQVVAFELVQRLNEQQRRETTPDDVEVAITHALVSGSEYFANVWSDAGTEGQAILRALAHNETPPHCPAARTWLREHDVLNEAGKFAVLMVERWVREQP